MFAGITLPSGATVASCKIFPWACASIIITPSKVEFSMSVSLRDTLKNMSILNFAVAYLSPIELGKKEASII